MSLLNFPNRNVKDKILHIKNSRLIQDPFPAHSQYASRARFLDQVQKSTSFFSRIFKKKLTTISIDGHDKPKDVSIWKAYKIGYEQAYKEIMENIGDCWEEKKTPWEKQK